MADTKFSNDTRALFFIPGFYGAVTWGSWLILYFLNLIRIDPCSYSALVIYLFTEIMFLLSILCVLPKYRQYVAENDSEVSGDATQHRRTNHHRLILIILHLVGFIGLAKYVIDYSRTMGGFWWFMFALLNDAASIRAEAVFNSASSVGTQIGYAGWLAIGLTFYYIARKQLSRWWLIPALLQFAGNLAYIDKTKPLMILLTSLLIMLPSAINRVRVKKIVTWIAVTVFLTVMTFWLIAEWSSKAYFRSNNEATILPGITYDIYYYGVSGFAYFNKMLEINEPISYLPERTLYPVLKFTAMLGLTREPLSQVIEFYDVPFPTNVGTFLEPWYRDGGFLFVFLGILIFSFGLDYAGLFFLKARNPYADYAWANICFSVILAFISNKIISFPLWIFCGIGVTAVLLTNQNAYFRKLKTDRCESK
jgi:hypothetical protein